MQDAATVWQSHAAQLEERLKALEPGPLPADVAQDAIPAPLRGAVATEAAEAAEPLKPASDSLALGWRRWWRRVRGG